MRTGGDVSLVLAYVLETDEDEVCALVDYVCATREVAYRLFFETVVCVHPAGESAPYTELKFAGLPVGPAIPLAEDALRTGSVERLAAFIVEALQQEPKNRLERVETLTVGRDWPVGDAGRYVQAMLGFEGVQPRPAAGDPRTAHDHEPADHE